MSKNQPLLPRQSPTPQKVVKAADNIGVHDFPDAMRLVIDNQKITRLEWRNENTYVFLNGGRLRIMLEGKHLHDLIVSDGDMLATDWIIV